MEVAVHPNGEAVQRLTLEVESFCLASAAIDKLGLQLEYEPGELDANFYLVFAHKKLTGRLFKTFPEADTTYYCHLEDSRTLTAKNVCILRATARLDRLLRHHASNHTHVAEQIGEHLHHGEKALKGKVHPPAPDATLGGPSSISNKLVAFLRFCVS